MSGHLFNTIERYPVNIVKGSMTATLIADDGREYLDFWSDESTQSLGTDLSGLLREFAETGIPHQLPDIFPNPTREECARRLCEVYGYERVMFGNGGADSIETAIKLARKWAWTVGKRRALCYTLEGNFHGRSYGALGLSDSNGSGSPYHKHQYHWHDPIYTNWAGYGVLKADMDDIASVVVPEETAAIFMAPILGNNVVKSYPLDFYKQLREYCTANNILLVFDEIQSGSGWTGKYSAAQLFGVQPDIMVLGKRIALGFPMSACLAHEDVAGVMKPGSHFNTFAGSPFICWMALKWLDWLRFGGLAAIREKGVYIKDALERDLGHLERVDAHGMMIAFQLNYQAAGYSGWDLTREAFKDRLLIVTHREYGPIRFTPPISVTYEEINHAIATLWNSQLFLTARVMAAR